MSFVADQQTLDDLNLVNKYKSDSIFNLFNQVQTEGGEKLLEHMFRHPLTDPEKITGRSNTFIYFQKKALDFPFINDDINRAETYLNNDRRGNILAAGITNLKMQVLATLVRDDQYEVMQAGLKATIAVLTTFRQFLTQFNQDNDNGIKSTNSLHAADHSAAVAIFRDSRLDRLTKENFENLSLVKLTTYDYLLRHTLKQQMEQLLQIIFRLDVYIAVSKVGREGDFHYATPMEKQRNLVKMEQARHPALKKAVVNTLSYHQDANVIFLTGANMAGKSTLMKTFGITLYLAHMGFPLAVKQMEFSVKDGIYSSINVADNLNMGYSHFYAEVLRVKKVAQEVSSGKNMVVIFDELFKGTNVKDAHDATLATTQAFALYRNCFFMISTHIIEVGEVLKEKHANIQFCYMPTIMNGAVPTYPYNLQQGITTDRQGMMIIKNEGILELLNNIAILN